MSGGESCQESLVCQRRGQGERETVAGVLWQHWETGSMMVPPLSFFIVKYLSMHHSKK